MKTAGPEVKTPDQPEEQVMIALAPSANDTIPSYEINGDRVILMGETALVTSKSEPGAYREVDVLNHLCGCPAFAGIAGKFEGRGHCRHVDAVRAAEEMDRAAAQPVDTRPLCQRCGRKPALIVVGVQTKLCGCCTVKVQD